ncbi:MAG: hypothetical protein NTY11_02510 [Candidatus Parcubacteria bacterium]|nr:hypothetical protein [Candidatus Parcubacteria bacterium]
MSITKTSAILLISLGFIGGMVGTIASQAHAADTTTATTTTETITTTNPVATGNTLPKGHSPLGGDGNITAINGTTITMQEESDEGGAIYSIDASNATMTNNGATADLSVLKVGDKIFVQGTTSGTNVTATSISIGRPNEKCSKFEKDSASDKDSTSESEGDSTPDVNEVE